MSTLYSFLIFIIILLVYIHITIQYKKSEDLEIYEADYSSNQQIQDVCDVRQPVLFDMKSVNPIFFEHNISEILQHTKTEHEAQLKDVHDLTTGDYILLPFRSAIGLMETDDKSRFYSENNHNIIEDVVEHHYKTMDDFLKPKYVLQTKYDIMFGSNGAYTALKYHTHYRHFITVQTGRIAVKMTPWKSRKILKVDNDYEHYEFRSRINVWKPQEKYLNEMEQLKFLEFDVNPGFALYIPPYWFYSIQFNNSDSGPATVAAFTYNTIMNIAANLPQWGMYYLQQFNTTKKTLKTMDMSDSKETFENPTESVHEPILINESEIITDTPLQPTIDFTERANEQMN